jgi:hypothetical protein
MSTDSVIGGTGPGGEDHDEGQDYQQQRQRERALGVGLQSLEYGQRHRLGPPWRLPRT